MSLVTELWLATALLATIVTAINAGDQFAQVDNPGGTNSNQYSCTGAWGDYDNAGVLDLLACETTGKNALFHNQGNSNHWIKFQLQGLVAKRSAIRAKVRIKATIGGKTFWQMREISGGNFCQSDLRANFGLGDATNVDMVRIEWPSGNMQEERDVAPDQILHITEQVTIAPSNPWVSQGADVTLTSLSSGSYQWRFEGADLPSETNKTLKLINVQSTNAGYYGVVVSALMQTNTNFVYLAVDPTFTKITTGPIVTDSEASVLGSWGDYNNDGLLDLFVPNSAWATAGGAYNSLYQNLGGDQFERVTNALTTGFQVTWTGQWGDYDNDGDLDLFVLHPKWAKNELFRNEGGGLFTSVTNDLTSIAAYYTDASWIDLDRDGWLDLFVTTQELNGNQSKLNDFFFQNLGNGRFQAWTTNEVGDAVNDKATTYGAAWCDFDNDGNPDLYVPNYYGVGFLYRNDGTGKMKRWTAGSLPSHRPANSAIWGDFNNDGWFDLFTTMENGPTSFHVNQGNGQWADATATSGLSWSGNSYSPAVGDYDNDGDLDIYLANYNGKDILFVNKGDATFTSIDVGSPLRDGLSDSAVWVDYNNDGWLDLFKGCGDHNPTVNLLYRNSLADAGNHNHWLKVQLRGVASNRSGIGARIWVTAKMRGQEVHQVRQIMSSLFGGGNIGGLLTHFGLADATNVDLVRIEWPSGNVQELSNISPDQLLTVKEMVNIGPSNPFPSLNGSVTLTRAPVADATYQWQFNGADLAGQTNRMLNLTNILAEQEGRYSVVASILSSVITNFVYLHVDTQFTKITTGPLATDRGNSDNVAWGDYDEDGFVDAFVARYKVGQSALYHNQRNGTFENVPNVLPSDADSWSVLWADFDNDGYLDLFFAHDQKLATLHYNNGDGSFTTSQFVKVFPSQCGVADYNRDGRLDLYLSPQNAFRNVLYRNEDGRTFASLTNAGALVQTKTLGGVSWVDYDDDGWLEVHVADFGSSRNRLFHMNDNGLFEAVTNEITLDLPVSSVGGAWGDYDNDGRLDLFIAGYSTMSVLYLNVGQNKFKRVPYPQIHYSCNSAAAADYDNDGFPDIFLTSYIGEPNVLCHNNGDGTFTQITAGSPVSERPAGGNAGSYSGSWIDYDNDGFLDLYVVNGNDAATANTMNFLYHNNGNHNAWLKVKLVGTVSNRDGVGAKVRVQAKYAGQVRWQRRDISGGDVYNGNNQYAHFGLGNATNVDLVRIEWPSGIVQELRDVAPKQLLTVTEPAQLDAVGAGQVQIRSWKGMVFIVEASPDLSQGTWTPVATATNTTIPLLFVDPSAGSQSQRFYRVKTP